jgi:hypothetical protein
MTKLQTPMVKYFCVQESFFLADKGPAADATDAPLPWGFLCNPVTNVTMISIFCPFPSNGAPVEWNRQGETEVLGGENLSQCHFVDHKSQIFWPGIEPGPPRWDRNLLVHNPVEM